MKSWEKEALIVHCSRMCRFVFTRTVVPVGLVELMQLYL